MPRPGSVRLACLWVPLLSPKHMRLSKRKRINILHIERRINLRRRHINQLNVRYGHIVREQQ